MHPDQRYITLRDALARWRLQPSQPLWLWQEEEGWLGLGLLDTPPTQPLWKVSGWRDDQIELTLFLETEDHLRRFREVFGERASLPETVQAFPVVGTVWIPYIDAPRVLDTILHRIYALSDQETDIHWYGRAREAPYDYFRVYRMGCISMLLLGALVVFLLVTIACL